MPPPENRLPPVINKPKPPQPHKPPLDGQKSLREALAQVTGAKPIEPAPPPQSGLKEALHKVATNPPAGGELSPDVLRQMLDVDEPKKTN